MSASRLRAKGLSSMLLTGDPGKQLVGDSSRPHITAEFHRPQRVVVKAGLDRIIDQFRSVGERRSVELFRQVVQHEARRSKWQPADWPCPRP